jgi:hypothetical protein
VNEERPDEGLAGELAGFVRELRGLPAMSAEDQITRAREELHGPRAELHGPRGSSTALERSWQADPVFGWCSGTLATGDQEDGQSPLYDCDSSGWIRTTDLTIMSGAL